MKTNLKIFCLVAAFLLISHMCSLTAHAVVKNIEEDLSPEEELYLTTQLTEFVKQMHENPSEYIDPKTGKLMDELTAFQEYRRSMEASAARDYALEERQRKEREQRNRQIQSYIATPVINWSSKQYDELAQKKAHETVKQDKTWNKFLNDETKRTSYSVINTGTVLPAMLLTGLNSDLPGHLLAQVSEHVYDSPTGKMILIPQGSRLFGEYDSKIIFGQKRALIIWQRLIYPDGSTIELNGMAGTDKAGYAGFKGKVNNHFGPMFGTAMMVSVFAGLAHEYDNSYSDDSTTVTVNSEYGDTVTVVKEMAETLADMAESLFDKYLELAPTLTVSPGYRFSVICNREIVLPRYVPTWQPK